MAESPGMGLVGSSPQMGHAGGADELNSPSGNVYTLSRLSISKYEIDLVVGQMFNRYAPRNRHRQPPPVYQNMELLAKWPNPHP